MARVALLLCLWAQVNFNSSYVLLPGWGWTWKRLVLGCNYNSIFPLIALKRTDRHWKHCLLCLCPTASPSAEFPQLTVRPIEMGDFEAALAHTKPSAHHMTKRYEDFQREFESVWIPSPAPGWTWGHKSLNYFNNYLFIISASMTFMTTVPAVQKIFFM